MKMTQKMPRKTLYLVVDEDGDVDEVFETMKDALTYCKGFPEHAVYRYTRDAPIPPSGKRKS